MTLFPLLRRGSLGLVALGLLGTSGARAQPAPSTRPAETSKANSEDVAGLARIREEDEADARTQPYTMAELGAGLLSLPAADVCPSSPTVCERGETSLSLGLHNFYRYKAFAFGAGIVFATNLGSDKARGSSDLEREHVRRYFIVEGELRAYPFGASSWDLWLGASIGGVVVNDAFSVRLDREPYSDTATVAGRGATIGTEGLSAGVLAGGEWRLADRWSLGAKVRYASWFLPDQPERSPTGDFASLKGRVDMFDFGLVVAYRIPL